MLATAQHAEHPIETADHIARLEQMLASERANLHIATQGLQQIAMWTTATTQDLRQRALDALRVIGKEG